MRSFPMRIHRLPLCRRAASLARRACDVRRSCASATRNSSSSRLRGNVNTRLHRLDQGNQAAVILASAGLKRLGFADRESRRYSSPKKACLRSARAHWQWNAAPIAPMSRPCFSRWPTRRRPSRRRPSGLLASNLRRVAAPRLRRMQLDAGRSCGCVVSSPAATVAARCTESVRWSSPIAAEAAALGAVLGDEFLARGAAAILAEAVVTGALNGAGVVITRPARQAAGLAREVAALGGRPLVFPAIVIMPPEDEAPLREAQRTSRTMTSPSLSAPMPSSMVSAIPPRGRRIYLRLRRDRGPPPRWRQSALPTPGSRQRRWTAKDCSPCRSSPTSPGGASSSSAAPGGRELLRTTLEARGASVDQIECYRRARPASRSRRVDRRLARPARRRGNAHFRRGPRQPLGDF